MTMRTGVYELEIEARTDRLEEVLGFVDSHLEQMDCPMKAQMQIDVAVEEIFVNIAHYAYGAEPGKAVVRLETEVEPRAVSITFLDRGKPFDPLAKEDPDITLSVEDRRIGGLGIFMTKKIMDTVEYEYQNGQNTLTLKKQL